MKLYNGDCLEVLPSLEPNIQLTITSPPYFNMRDYSNDAREIGKEDNGEDYLLALKKVFSMVYSKTLKGGSCYVNLADKYNKKGSLMCLPDRFKIMMVELGWVCKNEIIWHKPNAIPSSAKNRFTNDFEKVFFFVKSKKYTFNTQYEKRTSKVSTSKKSNGKTKYENDNHEASVRQGMNKTRGQKLIEKRNELPNQKEFVDFLRKVTTRQELKQNTDIKASTIDHWFRYDDLGFSYPKVEDWKKVIDLVDDWSVDFYNINKGILSVSYEYDDINKNAAKGRIKRAVWSINTKPSKLKHFAPYPKDLILTPILASSNEGDIVLDPFMGSGTTGEVAIKNNRDFIGIELSQDFYNISRNRLECAK